jgi:phage N-6-adenine-methyltransferase
MNSLPQNEPPSSPPAIKSSVGRIWTPGMMSSVRQDWATPRALFEMLSQEFHFELNVCATAKTAKAPRWFHSAENAFKQDWADAALGGSVWMNPPYGRGIGLWIERAFHASRHGLTVVCLLPARTDTRWFHDYCLKGEIRFLRGRLYFDDQPQARAPFPSMIVIFRGKNDLVTLNRTEKRRLKHA